MERNWIYLDEKIIIAIIAGFGGTAWRKPYSAHSLHI